MDDVQATIDDAGIVHAITSIACDMLFAKQAYYKGEPNAQSLIAAALAKEGEAFAMLSKLRTGASKNIARNRLTDAFGGIAKRDGRYIVGVA